MVFGEIFEPVVDDDRSPYNLGVGKLFTGYEDPHGLNFLFLGVNNIEEIGLSNQSIDIQCDEFFDLKPSLSESLHSKLRSIQKDRRGQNRGEGVLSGRKIQVE